ncbi:MAG: DUF1080 domain-containing protein [Verrucomicrobia bacterium]|nr:DUF1080 domain-containing protein [Verrucomicrobiota bacterium]
MKTLLLSALVLSLVLCSVSDAPAAEHPLVYAKDGSGVYGYKDTPKLPWCEYLVHDPDRPAPKRINPGPALPPAPVPADAIVLFDGKDVSQWRSNSWRVVDGCLEASGNVMPRTKEQFGSFQLHLEWMPPANFNGPWYDRGNNGVSLHGLYEIQIFDSWTEKWCPDGQCAAVYGQTPPLVNACRPPGEWQSYDIAFTAPVIEDGKVVRPARITMFHNGVLVHLNQETYGGTGHRGLPRPVKVSEGPIVLAGHGCAVRFRNIWVRKL